MKFLNQMHDQVNLLPICISLSESEEWQIQTMSGEGKSRNQLKTR
jgi:hypothetical protein